MSHSVKVAELQRELALAVLQGEDKLDRPLTTAEVYRPGLELAGFFDHYPDRRLQVMGRTERDFYSALDKVSQRERARQLFVPGPPCLVVSRGMALPGELARAAVEEGVPVLGSPLTTTRLIGRLSHWLDNRLAPRKNIHGVLLDLYGVGVLLTGKSGIGKSETALELIQRGHLLVADDAVEIRRPAEDILVGKAPPVLKNMMELRGVGIIDIAVLYGAGAVRPDKRVELVLQFEPWREGGDYERLGLERESFDLFGVKVDRILVPVAPGRNLAIIAETAAINYRAQATKQSGAAELCRRLDAVMNKAGE